MPFISCHFAFSNCSAFLNNLSKTMNQPQAQFPRSKGTQKYCGWSKVALVDKQDGQRWLW